MIRKCFKVQRNGVILRRFFSNDSLKPSFSQKIPEGDDRVRRVCDHCDFIAYSNPKIVAGCIAVSNDNKILLCKRDIEPRKGYYYIYYYVI